MSVGEVFATLYIYMYVYLLYTHTHTYIYIYIYIYIRVHNLFLENNNFQLLSSPCDGVFRTGH